MDLDDIDKWSRELLQKEARKRGYINASMYSRPELIRIILRHDYSTTKIARDAAKTLLSKAKSAFRLGWNAAAHKARGGAKSAAHPPGAYIPPEGWEDSASRARAQAIQDAEWSEHDDPGAAAERDETVETGASSHDAAPRGEAEAAVAGDSADRNRASGVREADPAASSRDPVGAADSHGPSSVSVDLTADPVAARASARSMFPRPAAAAAPMGSSSDAAAVQPNPPQPTAAGTPSMHVDPTPELRPPAIAGAKGEAPPPLELQAALTSAQQSAAATPITEQRPPSVRVDPKPEWRPPAKDDVAPTEANMQLAPEKAASNAAADRFEYGSSPWSIRPAAPPQASPVLSLQFEQAPPSAAGPKDADRLSYGPHTEHGLHVRWQVSNDGVERARAVLGSQGELAVRIVAVRTDDHAVVHTEILDHGPVENRGDWTAPLPPNAARYVSAIGLRTPERFVSIVHAST